MLDIRTLLLLMMPQDRYETDPERRRAEIALYARLRPGAIEPRHVVLSR